jgi:hypothetical protein
MNVRTLGLARCGAAYPWRGAFEVHEECYGGAVLWVIRDHILMWVARNLSGGRIQVMESCGLLCVPSRVSTDPQIGLSIAQGGRDGWRLLFNGPGVHQSAAHRVAKP